MSITIRTAGLEEFLNEDDPFRILLLGVSSAGKTPWAAQAPKPLFMAVDKSAPASLAITGTPYAEIKSVEDALEFLDWYIREQTRPSFEYETLVIDTLSQLQRRHEQALLTRHGKRTLRDVDGGWDQLKTATSAILERVAKIQTNVIVLVHLKDKFDTPEYEPDLIGSAKWDVPKDFPFIGHIYMDWQDAEGAKEGEVSPKVGVRKIDWRPSGKFTILRSPGGLLDSTVVEFAGTDWQQMREGLRGGAKTLGVGQSAPVAEVAVPTAPPAEVAPPDIQGGPVEPKVAPPRKAAAKKTAAKKAEPAPVAAVAEGLGGEVVEQVDVSALIAAATSPDELKGLWAKHEDLWTEELTQKSKDRIAELAAEKEGN